MSNKEFVEELLLSLNNINNDVTRFKKIDPVRENQRFLLEENGYVVKRPSYEFGDKYIHHIMISIFLESCGSKNIILSNRLEIRSNSDKVLDKDVESLYKQVRSNLIRILLFARESAGEDLRGGPITIIPIRTIISEGYDKAKARILSEKSKTEVKNG